MNKTTISLLMLFLPLLTHAEGLLNYTPPQLGAPATRIGGGTRGFHLKIPQLEVLAPQHTALTGQAQPVLYWYVSESNMQHPIEITLTQDGVAEPLLEKQLPALPTSGLQAIRLVDYGVSLQAGEEYRWSVALINDPEQRSGDVIASATLRYQPLPSDITSIEQKAQAGYWYDALQTLVESHSPRTHELLEQIHLTIPDL